MNSIWMVSTVLQWVVIVALCLLVFSLVRQLGEITLRLNSGSSPAKEPEKPEAFEPYKDFPKVEVPLLNGSKFMAGGKQPVPCLIVTYSPSCLACAEMPEAVREFARHVPPEELQLLTILKAERDVAKRYIEERGLGEVSIAVEGEIPEHLRVGGSPFAVAVTPGGQVAASGKPKTLTHLLEMAQAARAMAELTPSHSRRKHEWGESAPYWNHNGEAKALSSRGAPELAGHEAAL